MMKNNTIMFIGDIHGKFDFYCDLLDKFAPISSIQVGDFGWGFPNEDPTTMDRLDKTMTAGGHRWVRGNHDNPDKPNPHRIPDGSFDESLNLFALGGAYSIDQSERTDGVDWWHNEELSIVELNAALDLYEEKKPRFVVTHDGPVDILYQMFPWFCNNDNIGSGRTRQAYDAMLEIHRPELYIFGHWHHTKDVIENGTRFICIGESDYIFVDMDSGKVWR